MFCDLNEVERQQHVDILFFGAARVLIVPVEVSSA
jgi:hypothetical protein